MGTAGSRPRYLWYPSVHALVAQWIEHQLAELGVGGSSPLERAIFQVSEDLTHCF